METLTIIGAGLAGCEAAWQAARHGIPVRLIEMRPLVNTPAHQGGDLAELVCSNSLRGAALSNAVGLLKEEMRRLGSLIITAADATAIPAGGALAVDRKRFSAYIEAKLNEQPLIEIFRQEVREILPGPLIIAAGPLASNAISAAISRLTGIEQLFFHDAIAPIISAESIDMGSVFFASRYGKGEGSDYLNCPFTKEQYLRFHKELQTAKLFPLRPFEEAPPQEVSPHEPPPQEVSPQEPPSQASPSQEVSPLKASSEKTPPDEKLFAGCMPIEAMAKLGVDTMRFGPLKPVGLTLPGGGEAYAVVQLRRENAQGSMYNLVGFQTRLTRQEQKRVFALIPGLRQAEFLRYGAMHRNTYINSPRLLQGDLRLASQPRIFFAGQITGVEGYVESAASGLVAGLNAARLLLGQPTVIFPQETALGGLLHYITTDTGAKDFQPMNVNFGLLPPLSRRIRNKQEKNLALAERALAALPQIF